MAGDAETVLVGGKVFTASLSKSWARPLAIRSGGFAGALLHQPSAEVRDAGKDFIVRVELAGKAKEGIDVQPTESSLRCLLLFLSGRAQRTGGRGRKVLFSLCLVRVRPLVLRMNSSR